MKKFFLLISLIFTLTQVTNAQVTDSTVEQLMTQRFLTCDDIFYNTIILIPKLYKAGRKDSLNAVVAYCKRNCGNYETIVSYEILSSIEKGTFREELRSTYHDTGLGNSLSQAYAYKKDILSYLVEYRKSAEIKKEPHNYPYYSYTAHVNYTEFIQSYAKTLLNKPKMSAVERFFVTYYAYPDSLKFSSIKDSVYNGSVLREAYDDHTEFGGVSYGLNVGMWQPDGKLSILGNHPFFGFFLGGRSKGFSCDVVFNIAFNKSPNTYEVYDDSLYQTTYFTQYYLGLDFGQALYRTKRTELALLAGFGYDGISTLDVSTNTKSTGKTLNSFNLNAGVGYKFYLKHKTDDKVVSHSYIGIQAKYNFVSYDNNGGTDLTGRSTTFTLIWGGYNKSVHHYYDKD